MLRLFHLPLLLLLHLTLSAPISTPAAVGSTQVPPLETVQCYHCFLHKRHNETKLYLNSTDLLSWETSGLNVDQAADYTEYCQVVNCSETCVIARSRVELSVPRALLFPTERPWYETTNTPPVPETQLTELEYRVCAAPRAKICSSFVEMKSENCVEETCTDDLCNQDFRTDSQLLIIVLAAVVSLLVCVVMVTLICCWYFKIRTRKNQKYQPVAPGSSKKRPSLRQSFMVKFKVGFVRTEVVKIEERSESCSSRTPAEKNDKKSKSKDKSAGKGNHDEKSTKDKAAKRKPDEKSKSKEKTAEKGKHDENSKSKDKTADKGKHDKNSKSKDKTAEKGKHDENSKSKDKTAEKGKHDENSKSKDKAAEKGKQKMTKSKDGRDNKTVEKGKEKIKNKDQNESEKGVKQKLLSFI